MPEIIHYILKLFISLTLVYFFYQVVLRKLTFYTWNRWYLLLYSLISFIIPFINIAFLLEKNQWKNIEAIQYVPILENYTLVSPAVEPVTPVFSLWNMMMFIMLAGIIIMLIRLSIQYLSVRKIRKSAVLLHNENLKLYHVDRNIIPFSFGNSIYVNRELHSEEDLKEIIRHEFVHVKQRHSIDILWSEFLCIINWYNPFAWLLRTAIRQNLEFIADNNVIQNGFDRKQYQFLLLKVTGVSNFSIANKFNYSSLKKRIAMMNKIKSARLNLVRFLFVLPLAAILLLAFRKNQVGVSTVAVNRHITDTIPQLVNEKGYFVEIIDVKGDRTVVVKNKNKNLIEEVSLLKWNENKNHYEKLYGAIIPAPPQMPAVPPAPGIGSTAVIAPAIEAIPDVSSSVTAISQSNNINTVQINPKISTSVSVAMQANIANPVQAQHLEVSSVSISSANSSNTVQVNPQVTTTTSVTSVTSSRGVIASVDGANYEEVTAAMGPEDLRLQIYRTTTREELNQIILKAKEKGATLTFDEIKYNEKNILKSLSGTIKNKDNQSTFSAKDFEKVIIIMASKDGRSNSFMIEIRVKDKVVS